MESSSTPDSVGTVGQKPEKKKRITKAMRWAEGETLPPTPDNFRCQTCTLHGQCLSPFMPAIGEVGKILIVGTGPDDYDDEVTHRPFTGQASKLLKQKVLLPLGLGKEDVAFTHAVRCRPPAGKVLEHQLLMCRAFVQQDINRLCPQKIICLGSVAAASVLGKKLSETVIKELSGQVHYAHRDVPFDPADPANTTVREPIPVIVTYHPSSVAYGGSLDLIMKHIKEFVTDTMRHVDVPEMEVLP